MKTHVKKGDEVEIIAGRNHKGKRGTVLAVNASKGTVIVEGVRTLKRLCARRNRTRKAAFRRLTARFTSPT